MVSITVAQENRISGLIWAAGVGIRPCTGPHSPNPSPAERLHACDIGHIFPQIDFHVRTKSK